MTFYECWMLVLTIALVILAAATLAVIWWRGKAGQDTGQEEQ